MCKKLKLSNVFFVSRDKGAFEYQLLPGMQGMGALTLGSSFQHCDLQSSSIVSPVYAITPSFLGGEQRTPAVSADLLQQKEPEKTKPSISSITVHFNRMKDMQP